MLRLAPIRALAGAALLGTLSLGGCACEETPTNIVGLAFVSPNPGSRIQVTDDLDPNTPGVQVAFRLRAVGLNATDTAATVSLINKSDVDGVAAEAVLVGNGTTKSASFDAITLVSGTNEIEATLTQTFGSNKVTTANFSVVAPGGPACRFTQAPNGPALNSGATLTDDLDVINAGFQTHVGVACDGEGVVDGLTVGLNVAGAASALSGTLQAGSVVFNNVSLPEGAARLTTYVVLGQDQAGTASLDLVVDTGRCDVSVTSPANGVPILAADDADPSTPDVADVDIVIASSRCGSGSTVTIPVGADSFSGAIGEDGTGTVRIALTQSSDNQDLKSFTVVVSDQSGSRNQGTSLLQVHLVDTIAPSIEVVGLAADSTTVLTAADDQDENPLDELTYRVQVRLTDYADVALVFARVGDDEAGVVSAAPNELGIATMDVRLPAGNQTVTVYASDAAGNQTSVARQVEVDITVPVVTLLQPAQSGAVLANADADPQTEGFQLDCYVSIENFSTISTLDPRVFCELQTLDDQGNATGPWVASALAEPEAREGDIGVGGVRLTLPDGQWGIRAGAVTRGGTGNRAAPSDPLNLNVDGTVPTIAFASPTNGSVINAGNANIELAITDAEVGQPVSVSVDGAPALNPAPTVDQNGRALIENVVWADRDGTYTLTADVSDAAGNPATQASISVTVDSTPPVVTLLGLDGSAEGSVRDIVADGILNATQNINLDWGADVSNGFQYGFRVVVRNEPVGQLVALRLNGALINGVTVDDNGAQVANFNNNNNGFTLLEGVNTVSATVIDNAGNTASSTATLTVTTGQPFVRILAPADGSRTNANQVAVTASSNAADGATCSLVASLQGQQDVSANANAGGDGAIDFGTLNLAAEGSWSLVATCPYQGRDPVNSAASTVIVDQTAPVLTFTGVPQVNGENVYTLADEPDSTLNNQYRKDIVVSAAANGVCTVEGVNPTALLTITGGNVGQNDVVRTRFTAGNDCSFTFENLALADEVNDPNSSVNLAVSTVDLAGNQGVASIALVVDRVGPTVVIDQPVTNAILSADDDANQASPNVQYDVQATARGAVGVAQLQVDGQNVAQRNVTGNGSVEFDNVSFADGTHTVRVSGVDNYNNTGFAESTNVRVDGSAPTLTIFTPGNNQLFGANDDSNPQLGGFQTNVSITIQGVENGTQIQVLVDGVQEATGAVAGNFTSIPNVPLTEGTREITVRASDGINTATATVSVTVDLTAPTTTDCVFAGDDGPNAGIYTFNVAEDGDGQAAGWQGTCATTVTGGQDGSVVRVVSNNPAPNTVVGSAVLQNGAATASISLPDGSHTLTIQATDEAGNVSAAGIGQVARVDTVAPVVSLTSPANGAFLLANQDGDNETPGLQFTVAASSDAEAGTSIVFNANDAQLGTNVIEGGAGSVVATLPEGSVSLTAVSTDQAGNSTTSAAVSVTVDSQAPTIAITSPAANTELGDNDDVDEGLIGFQTNISVTTGQVENGQQVSVRSTVGGERCSEVTSGALLTMRCTLLEGAPQTLTAVVSDANGNETTSAGVVINLNLQAPTLIFTTPNVNPARLNSGDDVDGAEGFQYTFVLTSDADGQTVELSDDGNAIGTGVVANNSVTIGPVTLSEGTHPIRASVTQNNNTAQTDLSVIVDVTAPTIALNSPAVSPATFAVANDQQAGAPLNTSFGLQITGAIGGTLSAQSTQTATLGTVAVNADGVVTITGATLQTGVTHEITFTVTDEAGNTASVELQAVVDVVAPNDLAITATPQNNRSGTVRLNWSESGDDADQGVVAGYQVRYSENVINEDNFGAATQVQEAINPVAPGNALQVDVAGLPFDNANVRIAARAVDDVGNVSAVAGGALATVDLSLNSSIKAAAGSGTDFGYDSCSGDFNNDNRADLVLGDYKNSNNTGAIWILMGNANMENATLTRRLGNAAGDYYGFACAAADFNEDGFDDLAVGAIGPAGFNGQVYIYRGSANGVSETPVATITGTGNTGTFGAAISAGGSVVGDGTVDLAIGAGFASGQAGQIWVFDGDNLTGNLTTAGVPTITGPAGSRLGTNVIIGKDVTGDGQADLVTGMWRYNGIDGGFLVIAGPITDSALTSAHPSATLIPGSTGRRVGIYLAVGDVDGDGGMDILGATARFGYQVHVYHGGQALDTTLDRIISRPPGVDTNYFGVIDEMSICDIDGDGEDELFVGGQNYSWLFDHAALTATPMRAYDDGVGYIHPVCYGDADNNQQRDFAIIVRNADGSVILKH